MSDSEDSGEHYLFQDTIPITELDPSLNEKLYFVDSEILDSVQMNEIDQEIVLDSEDEEVSRNPNRSFGIKGDFIDDNDSNSGIKDVVFEELECDKKEKHLRLNYVACDEPGDSSQRNALEFVDRFLLVNDVGVFAANQCVGSVRENVSPVNSMSGSRSLAKRLVGRNLGVIDGAFEWDGGIGDGCLQGEYVGSKVGSSSSNVCEEKSVKLHQCVEVPSQSDSMTENFGYQEMCGDVVEMIVESGLVKKPEDQLPAFSVGQELDDCSGERNVADLFDIGFGTQMAAEAIEALSHGPSAHHYAADYAYQGHQNSAVDSSKGLEKSRAHSQKPCAQVGALSNFEGITRVSKPRTRHPRRRGKAFHGDSAVPTTKRDSTSPNGSSNVKSLKLLVQRKGEKDAGKSNVQCEYMASSSTFVENILVFEQEVPGKDWLATDKLKRSKDGSDSIQKGMLSPEVDIMTYRRKKRTPSSDKPPEISKDGSDKLKISMDVSDSLGERMLSPEVSIVYRRRKRTPLSDKTSEILSIEGTCTNTCSETSRKVTSTDHSQEEQTTGSILGLNSLLQSDAWECLKRKRKHRKMLPRANGFGNRYGTFEKIDGQEHYKKLPKNLSKPKSSLMKELNRLGIPELAPNHARKDLRKRRHVSSSVRVLFSQHLQNYIIRLQKKIIARLGISIASSLADATHFIADEFLRTRNMLEAIALGKPVVTHLWLESCGQAGCVVDEKNYILRDAKKERDIGFSLPVSLVSASQRPLLEGRNVFLTPNVQPDTEIISSLVEATRGLVVDGEQIISGKSHDDLLILSCEEDRQFCLPFIHKGLAVYSTELLLNGIVIQKLEYARHQLYAKCVEKSRSRKR